MLRPHLVLLALFLTACGASLGRYQRACDAGEGQACFDAGQAYATGAGVRRDLPQALDYYRRACDAGVVSGCARSGEALLCGADSEQGEQAGLQLLDKACAQNEVRACSRLGTWSLVQGPTHDEARALTAFDKACNQGDPRACVTEGDLLLRGVGGKSDPRRARELHQKACDAHTAAGCERLLLSSTVAEQARPPRPMRERACQGGLASACLDLVEPDVVPPPPPPPPPAKAGSDDVPLPPPEAEAPAAPRPEGLSSAEVALVIALHDADVRACETRAATCDPRQTGRLLLHLVVDAAGRVRFAEAQCSTFPSSAVPDCIVQSAQGWSFPKPRGGNSVELHYPFEFAEAER